MKSGIGVKAFIVDNNKVLLIKRWLKDPHNPGLWDMPGGRLKEGEDPVTGLKRECMEELAVDIHVTMPIETHSFTRDDGQFITLIVLLCCLNDKNIKLSEAHTEYQWFDLDSKTQGLEPWLIAPIDNYKKYINE